MNGNYFARMWKEAIVPYLRQYVSSCREMLRKTIKNLNENSYPPN
jgi:hypothetical protein